MFPVFSSPRHTLASGKKTRRSRGWSGLTKITTNGWFLLPRIRVWIPCTLSHASRLCCAACTSRSSPRNLNNRSSSVPFYKVAHSIRRCDSHPNYALLFGGICIQRLKVALLLRLVDRSGLWARDLLARVMKGCSMNRKSVIYGIQSSGATGGQGRKHGDWPLTRLLVAGLRQRTQSG